MQFKSIIAIIAATAIGGAIAGPLPIAIDEDGVAMTLPQARELVARDLEARAEAVEQDAQAAQTADAFPFNFGYNQRGGRYGTGIDFSNRGLSYNMGNNQLSFSRNGLAYKVGGTNYNLNSYYPGAATAGAVLFGNRGIFG